MLNSVLYRSSEPHALAHGSYLTDETRLYPVIGPVDHSMAFLMLEDCHTLDVVLVETHKVGVLRHVTPSCADA
jgi:hypothetical protein